MAGDLAFALASAFEETIVLEDGTTMDVDTPLERAIPELNRQPQQGDTLVVDETFPGTTVIPTDFPAPINTAGPIATDPFTPMMRVRRGDTVKVKIQAGGHEHEHNASIHGVKWLQGGSGHGRRPTPAGVMPRRRASPSSSPSRYR